MAAYGRGAYNGDMGGDSGSKIVMIAAGLIAGLYLTSDSSLNRPAPAFSLPQAYGGHVSLEVYRGHPVLLAFWTTSCGTCRRELPLLSHFQTDFRRKGVEILAIHLGDGDEARDYMRENNINLKLASDPDGSVGQAYRVSGVPKLVLIGSDGKIKRSRSGGMGESALRDWADSAATR
jgi:peroxiredoxin